MRLPLALLLLPTLAAVAVAADGVLEINQTCAVETGCFAGDTAGFPVVITEPGSYRLTGNLDTRGLPNAINVTAIRVETNDASIDLNGSSLIGPVVCTGSPPDSTVTCSATGNSSVGVTVGSNPSTPGEAYVGTRIFDGTIEGFAFGGINCPTQCFIDNMVVRSNEGIGINGGNQGSVVTNTVMSQNLSSGISAQRIRLESCLANRNGGGGFRLGPSSTLIDSVALRNTVQGVIFFGVVGEDSPAAMGRTTLTRNNGGNANSQVQGPFFSLGPNLCGLTACP